MRRLLLALLFVPALYAQTNCAGLSTCNLVSADMASSATFRTAISTVNQNPTTVNVPAGSFTWANAATGSPLTLSVSIIIQGAGAVSSTANGTSTTGSDLTTIIDNTTSANSPINYATTAGQSLRITGIFFSASASSVSKTDGIIKTSGGSSSIRIDHCHFLINGSNPQGISFGGKEVGVVDHVFFESPYNILTNDLIFHEEQWLGESSFLGDGSFHDTEHWGSSQFMFVEDTRFHNGSIGDGSWGGRYVLRHITCVTDTTNSSTSAQCQMFNHGLTSGSQRGMRASEIYSNTILQGAASPGVNYPFQGINGGTMLAWGNTVSLTTKAFQIDYTRKQHVSTNYTYNPTPGGWDYCDGVHFSGWDDPSGYPCLEMPGRGNGDLLGGALPTRCNLTTNPACNIFTGQQTHQDLSPIYVWNNTFASATGYGCSPNCPLVAISTAMVQNNREVYQQFGNGGNAGSFNGTSGVGQGLLSARPGTCTAGVGYWATDQNILYVCGPSNWTGSTCPSSSATLSGAAGGCYTPYNYPHPLTGGGGTATLSVSCPSSPCPSIAFGSVFVGNNSPDTLVTLTNGGTAILTSLVMDLSDSSNYQIANNICGSQLGPSASCSFFVRFHPLSVASFPATVTMTSNATNSPSIINLSGTGIPPQASTPIFSPTPGTYVQALPVSISAATGPVICYTTNGVAPVTDGASGCTSGTLYSGPIPVSGTTDFFAVAGGTNYTDSAVAPGFYTTTATGLGRSVFASIFK